MFLFVVTISLHRSMTGDQLHKRNSLTPLAFNKVTFIINNITKTTCFSLLLALSSILSIFFVFTLYFIIFFINFFNSFIVFYFSCFFFCSLFSYLLKSSSEPGDSYFGIFDFKLFLDCFFNMLFQNDKLNFSNLKKTLKKSLLSNFFELYYNLFRLPTGEVEENVIRSWLKSGRCWMDG